VPPSIIGERIDWDVPVAARFALSWAHGVPVVSFVPIQACVKTKFVGAPYPI